MKILSKFCAMAGLGLMLGVQTALAQVATPKPANATGSPNAITPPNVRDGGPVTLNLRDVSLTDALNTLFRTRTTARYILDNAVTQNPPPVNVTIRNQPFDAALNAILRSAGLRAIRKHRNYWSMRRPRRSRSRTR